MRVLLVSTYELGHLPIHVASPAAALGQAGHDVSAVDLAVDPFDVGLLQNMDAVAISVPMHTAMRLAIPLVELMRSERPELPIAFYGLYAGVGHDETAGDLVDSRLVGEYEDALIEWVGSTGQRPTSALTRSLTTTDFGVPDRSVLPHSDEYARLEWNGATRKAAAVEASHGCRHRCTHCPIPPVYDGRLKVVGAEIVLADIDQLANSGVEHVSFGDPDFLNAPKYSLDILREAHQRHPEMTFDVTVKVEHILKHAQLWPEMRGLGVLFVVSAFESVDDRTLEILAKDHTVADMAEALEILRLAGVHVRPTWLPFMPWTSQEDLIGLVGFLDTHKLWSATDPVQLSIKLLLPEGSLLEEHPAVVEHLDHYDTAGLTWRWRFADPVVELIHKELDAIAADASDCGQDAPVTLAEMRRRILERCGQPGGSMPPSEEAAPRLTESWFCCSEPTSVQSSAVEISVGRLLAR